MKSSDLRLAITTAMTVEAQTAMGGMDGYACPTQIKNLERERADGLHALRVLQRLAEECFEGADLSIVSGHYHREWMRLADYAPGSRDCLPVPEVQELEGCRG